MHNRFHHKRNVNCLYLLRSEGGRVLTGVQDTEETAILELTKYVRNSKGELLIAACIIEDNEDRKTPKFSKSLQKSCFFKTHLSDYFRFFQKSLHLLFLLMPHFFVGFF